MKKRSADSKKSDSNIFAETCRLFWLCLKCVLRCVMWTWQYSVNWLFGFSQNLAAGFLVLVFAYFGLVPKVVDWFNKNQNKTITDATAYVGKGLALSNKGDYIDAAEQYQKALNLRPTNISALNYLGYAYIQTKRNNEAVSVLNEAVALDGANGWCRYNYILALALTNDKEGLGKQLNELEAIDKVTGDSFIHMLNRDRTFTSLPIYQDFKAELLKKDVGRIHGVGN